MVFRIVSEGAKADVHSTLSTPLEPARPPRAEGEKPGEARPDPFGEKVRELVAAVIAAGPEHDDTPEAEGGPVAYRWHVNAAGDDETGTPWADITIRCLPGER